MKRAVVFILVLLGFIGAVRKEKPALTAYVFPELRFFPKMPGNEKNPVTQEGAELGRFLFHDVNLSEDKKISCASCHKQEFAFSDSPNAFSNGIKGTAMRRNTPGLFNLAWYPTMFWDGKAVSIEDQVFHPVRAHDEMNITWKEVEKRLNKNRFYKEKFKTVFGDKKIDSTMIAFAIAQFERTLLSYRSKFDKVLKGEEKFSADEKDGFVLVNDMTKGDCLHCHTTDANVLGTTSSFSNNGLDAVYEEDAYKDRGRGEVTCNKSDNGKFKIPSLRNVAITAPYMHDGRFKTLEEVLDFYSEGVHKSANVDSKMSAAGKGGLKLSCDEKRKIIAFLKTLTDSAFIQDPAFADPFRNKK